MQHGSGGEEGGRHGEGGRGGGEGGLLMVINVSCDLVFLNIDHITAMPTMPE